MRLTLTNGTTYWGPNTTYTTLSSSSQTDSDGDGIPDVADPDVETHGAERVKFVYTGPSGSFVTIWSNGLILYSDSNATSGNVELAVRHGVPVQFDHQYAINGSPPPGQSLDLDIYTPGSVPSTWIQAPLVNFIAIRSFNNNATPEPGLSFDEPVDTNYERMLLDLVPSSMVPDFNGDGSINDIDVGRVDDTSPYYFWINDDDDGNPEPEFGDIPGSAVDNGDMIVNTSRDLLDFFPVDLRISRLFDFFPRNDFDYKIAHPNGALNFLELPTLDPAAPRDSNGAGSYLATQAGQSAAMAAQLKSATNAGATLSNAFLDAAAVGNGILLFESIQGSNQGIELVISEKQTNALKLRKKILDLKLDEVEKFYWRTNLRPVITVTNGQPVNIVPGDQAFKDSRKDRWFIFCHGYNVTEDDARGWNSEIFKRLTQQGFQSRFVGISWEGSQGLIGVFMPFKSGFAPDYWQNVYNAFMSAEHLALEVNALSGGKDKKVVAAHSLGCMLTSSAFCDYGMKAERSFMMNAAVAREAFDALHILDDRPLMRHPNWDAEPERLWASDYWDIFPNGDGRRNLKWADLFRDLREKTTPHNFYSPGEDVLRHGDSTVPGALDVVFGGQWAWVKSEMGKGSLLKRFVTTISNENWQSNGGWAFNSYWLSPPATDPPLIVNPYFKPTGIPNTTQTIHNNTNGSTLASTFWIRSYLLAHDFPAISNPAGSNEVDLGGDPRDKNTDLHTLRTEVWGNWLHSDLKKRDNYYVWKLYKEIIEKGELNLHLNPTPTS